MNSFENEPKPLRTLPLYTASAAHAGRLFHKQRIEPDRRAEHARAQLARQRLHTVSLGADHGDSDHP